MSKIYSRRRFLIKPKINSRNPKSFYNKLSNKKVFIILFFILIIFIIIKLILNYIEPIFETICEDKAKSLATIITNQQSTIVMNDYKDEELYTIEKDENGNIKLIKANIVPINNMMSDLAEKIQKEFDDIEKTTINISAGALTGLYMLSGSGPDITIRLSVVGNIDTDVKSEFVSQGINQTLHRLYVELTCTVKIVTPLRNYEKDILNQVIIAENVIIGDIPNTYYNLEGLEDSTNSLEVIN